MSNHDSNTATGVSTIAREAAGRAGLKVSTLEAGRPITVTNIEQYAAAGEWVKSAKAMIQQIINYHKPLKQAQDAAKKKILAAEKGELQPWQFAVAEVEGKMLGWWNEDRRQKEAAAVIEQKAADKTAKNAGVPSTPVFVAETKVTGITPRTYWHAELDDLETLVKAIAAGEASLQCVTPNMTYLNDKARLMMKKFNIPGVKAVSDQGLTTRS